jgi:hypothetical protein
VRVVVCQLVMGFTVREAVGTHRALIASLRQERRIIRLSPAAPGYGEVEIVACDAASDGAVILAVVRFSHCSVGIWSGRGEAHRLTQYCLYERKIPGKGPLAAGGGQGQHRVRLRGR